MLVDFTIQLEEDLVTEFNAICGLNDVDPSHIIERFMRGHVCKSDPDPETAEIKRLIQVEVKRIQQGEGNAEIIKNDELDGWYTILTSNDYDCWIESFENIHDAVAYCNRNHLYWTSELYEATPYME